ncbi:cobalt-precorrin-6A reductase [Frankia sp. R82]|uniref:cobalt-precorrin-6A reductase n=1 Tax=Frankia sp. R82 TaxID=2950553 RepID=UPI0035AB9138
MPPAPAGCPTPAEQGPPASPASAPGARPSGVLRRVLLLGGSGEARQLATALAADGRHEVLYSLAGRVRDPRVPSSCRIRIGGFGGPDGLVELLLAERIDLLVDATHPFAARMQASAATASAASGVPLVVLRRPGWREQPGDDWRRVPSMAAAVELLDRFASAPATATDLALSTDPATAADPVPATDGVVPADSTGSGPRVFLTTGRGDLGLFARLDRPWFLVRCVEPPDAALPPRHAVLLDRGPFDVAAERDLLRRYAIDVVITKDSGGPMTAAKLTAARELGLPVILVDRPATPPGIDLVNIVDSVDAALTRITAQHAS